MKQHPCRVSRCLTAFAFGLTLLAPGVSRAADVYKIEPVLKVGDKVGDFQIPSGSSYSLFHSLNDRGQLLIDVGAVDSSRAEEVLRLSDGKFTRILGPGLEGPVGQWPRDVSIAGPFSMNQQGNAVLSVQKSGGTTSMGTFLWDYAAQSLTPVALKGMPAVQNLTLTDPGGFAPSLNNRDEIAFPARVGGSEGVSGFGIFFWGRDRALQPVLLPGQELPGGGKARTNPFLEPSLDDEGRVAFLVRRQGQTQSDAYLWEKGTLTPLLLAGAEVPGIGTINAVTSVLLNNQNRTALVTATLKGAATRHGVYRVENSQLTPVAVPGQEMPGGGRFRTVQNTGAGADGVSLAFGISPANAAGQHAVLAALDDNTTGAYRIDPDGKLSLIVKSGTATEFGTLTRLTRGAAPSLNSQGQVALTVSFDRGPDTIVLLTPAPAP